MLKKRRHTSFRGQSGQVLPAGITAIWLMALLFVGFLVVSMFIGSYINNTIKLSFAAQQAALYGMNKMYYAGCPRPKASIQDAQAKAAKAIQPILDEMGCSQATVEFDVVSANGSRFGQSTITAQAVPVLGGGATILGAGLPSSLTITQTAVQAGFVPPFIAEVAATAGSNNQTGCVQLPCVAAGSPWNGGAAPSYYAGSLGVPGGNVSSAPGYVALEIESQSSNGLARPPYSAGPDWAY